MVTLSSHLNARAEIRTKSFRSVKSFYAACILRALFLMYPSCIMSLFLSTNKAPEFMYNSNLHILYRYQPSYNNATKYFS